MELFLVKKFGRTQTEEILKEKLSKENNELKWEIAKLRPLPQHLQNLQQEVAQLEN